jgi:hypothetical protein
MLALSQPSFRTPLFDIFFIVMIPLLGITAAVIAGLSPMSYETVLSLNLFFLGYHHVISTYTRLGVSQLNTNETRFLTLLLPFLVLAFVVACALLGVIWLIPTIYLHWQWWHYTRQSEGISKAIRFKTKSCEGGDERFNRLVFYAIPVAAFSVMSARDPATFLFVRVETLPIPMSLATGLVIIAVALQLVWLWNQIFALKQGTLKLQHFAYLLSHHTIYWLAYAVISNIDIGWIAINVWHNAQYIAFVWHFNTQRFREGFSRKNPILSWLCQPRAPRILIYFFVCLSLTYFFYDGVDWSVRYLADYSALPLAIIAYQTINFHHYIVDTLIWKLRKPTVRENI